MSDRRAVVVTAIVLALGLGAIWLLRPKRAVAAPAPSGSSTSTGTDALLAKVQQERRDELAQWQIVQRTVTRQLANPVDPYDLRAQAELKAQLANANLKVQSLEQEIMSHGG